MNTAIRKLNLIAYIAELKDEKFLGQIENFTLEENPDTGNPEFVIVKPKSGTKERPGPHSE